MVKRQSILHLFVCIGAASIGLALLVQCSQESKPARDLTLGAPPKDGELHFDERYLDSLYVPRSSFSARTWRELAIRHQLTRLKLARIPSPVGEPEGPVSTQTEVDGPTVVFPNEAADLADIYRRIDSLKVLEHLPVTPHPPLKPFTIPHHVR